MMKVMMIKIKMMTTIEVQGKSTDLKGECFQY